MADDRYGSEAKSGLPSEAEEAYGRLTDWTAHWYQAIWYKIAGNEPLSIVMVGDLCGGYPDTVFFDTDTIASNEETIGRFSHRWRIEITHRETKKTARQCRPTVPLQGIAHSCSYFSPRLSEG